MDPELFFRFFLALAVVIGLVLMAGAAARRFGLMPAAGALRGKGRQGRRLHLVEVRPVDTRRRLVLVRCDDREHLLLIGGTHDLVVETGIVSPAEDAPPLPTPQDDKDPVS
jgi:flagellar protein FliO/FliZ